VGMTALLLFFSMAAIRARFAAVHIRSLNHGPPQTATPFSNGLLEMLLKHICNYSLSLAA
jgi:hypothetical protein